MTRLNEESSSAWDAARKSSTHSGLGELTFAEHSKARALDTQIGGSHYKDMAIQPAEFNHRNHISYLLGTAISYIAREGTKDEALSDVKKAIHILEMYVEMEEQNDSGI